MEGLSEIEVQERRRQFGYNELPVQQQKTVLRIAMEVVREPMFMLLLGCAILYILLGDYTEGAVMLGSVLLIIFITFFQHQRTERALEALKRLSSPRALVIRNGVEQRIAGRDVVPEDLVILNEGDRIPADARILTAQNFHVDESMLTGESVAVHKSSDDAVYSGSLVVKGKARVIVTHTGVNTEFGKIGASLEQIDQGQTNLQKEMRTLVVRLFILGGLISVLVVLGFYLTRGDLIRSFLNGLASAMAILPEEFPVVLTIFLAMGAWRLSKRNVLTRKPSAIETLGSATVLCSDKTGTITQNRMQVVSLFTGSALIQTDQFENKREEIGSLIKGCCMATPEDTADPMEIAIKEIGQRFKVEEQGIVAREYALSKSLLAMSLAYEVKDGFEVYAKGSPESIIELCHIDNPNSDQLMGRVGEMAKQGLRILGVARAKHQDNHLPEDQHDLDFEFLGLVGLADPIREEVPSAVKECYDAGIKVIMITGDYAETAASIASEAGIDVSAGVISGNELSQMSDIELIEKIREVNVFARIVPEQKLRIIQALKSNNEVVAMTGDGVNDAPALKAADIGIAMGKKGTDVARESASLVLLDDNFSSIVAAIRSGRRIYDNLQKSMMYIMAIHIPIIGLTLLPAFFSSLPIILMPLHIIFMELIIDPVCSLAFESEEEEAGIMSRPPRDPAYKFFGFRRIIWSVFMGFLLLVSVLGVYFYSFYEGHSEGEVRVIAFTTLILGNIALILTSLSKTRFVLHVIMERNIALLAILGIATSLLIGMISLPYLQELFDFDPPHWGHFWVSLVAVFILLTVLEVTKLLRIYKHKK